MLPRGTCWENNEQFTSRYNVFGSRVLVKNWVFLSWCLRWVLSFDGLLTNSAEEPLYDWHSRHCEEIFRAKLFVDKFLCLDLKWAERYLRMLFDWDFVIFGKDFRRTGVVYEKVGWGCDLPHKYICVNRCQLASRDGCGYFG